MKPEKSSLNLDKKKPSVDVKMAISLHSVEKREILLVKPLLSRNFCQISVGENFRNFHFTFFYTVVN